MELLVYGALGPPSGEHGLALRLLALALERELGIHPLPEIRRAAGGKPYFPSCPSLHFNLSHSRGAAVCALHSLPVGVDVERLRAAPRRLAQGMADEAFFRLWTARLPQIIWQWKILKWKNTFAVIALWRISYI